MRYEHKDMIVEDIGPEPNCNHPAEVGRYYSKLEELDEVYRKAEAFDRVKKEIRKNASYLFTKTPSEKRNAQIDILNGILIAMDNAEFDAEGEEADQ